MGRVAYEFEQFGLTGSEARVLLALLRFGAGNATRVAEMAKVPRQRAYEVLASLVAKRLVQELPGKVASWGPLTREATVERLYALQEERLRDARNRLDALREVLSAVVPSDTDTPALPFATVIRDPKQASVVSSRLQEQAQFEVLALNRPPYADRGVNQGELTGLARGVVHKDIYGRGELDDPSATHTHQRLALYGEAGEQARVVESVPLKMVIVDRRAVLMGLPNPDEGDAAGLTAVLVEHLGFAEFCAAAFEEYWAHGQPLVAHASEAQTQP